MHSETHPNTKKMVDFSIDGVAKDKSSLVPVDIFSIRFTNCRRIYTLCVVRVDRYEHYDIQEFIDICISQIT